MTEPEVVISYSQDSAEHIAWVRQLATDLQAKGIDIILDQWSLPFGADLAAFMERSITAADRVLLICTERYVEKAEQGSGGVGYERLIVTGELVARIETKKFIPVIRQAGGQHRLPVFLGPRRYIDFSNDANYGSRVDELAREIHGLSLKPPVGPNPYASTTPPSPPPTEKRRTSSPVHEGIPTLDDEWFARNAATASAGLERTGRRGAMELRAALYDPVNKTQLDLINAVRKAEIQTFGWPIGILLENNDQYRPRPMSDSVTAEIAISEKGMFGETSYDYWAVRRSGDYYLLQSLFEDERKREMLFFNTRIVRIAEALLFCRGLYEALGAAPAAKLTVRISHRGLAGRTLGSSSGNRNIRPRQTAEDQSATEVSDTLAGIRDRLTEHVMAVAQPLFAIFDFAEFGVPVYADIVTKFVAGQVT